MRISNYYLSSCSSCPSQSFRPSKSPIPSNRTRKKIGPFSYYLDDCIGSGYSSQVFRGRHIDHPQAVYAIKVIKTKGMDKANHELLKGEINVLRKLEHPNLIKFHEAYFTPNNCYLVTDYCEGGTLQSSIESNPRLQWEEIFIQLFQGLRYLASNLIIHRDLKPANIFLQNGVWKIGDLGFARYLPNKEAQIKQNYMVGSPLYMPPETLEKKIYSLKTDSFAFGILLFHLATRQFPWSGNNKKELLENYSNKQYPSVKIQHLPPHYQVYLKGLCEIEISRRLYIDQFQVEFEKSNMSMETIPQLFYQEMDFISRLRYQIEKAGLTITEKFVICKFIHYIDTNIQHFSDMCELSENLRRVIKSLGMAFGWCGDSSFSKYMDEFKCRNYQEIREEKQIQAIQKICNKKMASLKGSMISRCIVLNLKLEQLVNVLEQMMLEDGDLKTLLNTLVLHSDFSKVYTK